MSDLVNELRDLSGDIREHGISTLDAPRLASKFGQCATRIEALEAEVQRLREALKPFAGQVQAADNLAAKMGFAHSFDEYARSWIFTFGDLRRARAAMEPTNE